MTVPLLTPEKTAETLGISISMFYKIARQGLIPVVRIGTSIRILPDDLDQFIAASRSTNPRQQRKRTPQQQSRQKVVGLVDPLSTGR